MLSSGNISSRKPSLASSPCLPTGASPLYFPSPSPPWLLPVVLQLSVYFFVSFIRMWTLRRSGLCYFPQTVPSKCKQSTEMSLNLASQTFPGTTFPKRRTVRALTVYTEGENARGKGIIKNSLQGRTQATEWRREKPQSKERPAHI